MREYQIYEHLPKDERRDMAPAELEKKRFILSSMPEWRERIHNLHDILEKLQVRHPEIISLSLFGSQVKGYANESSDIDLYVHVDGNKWEEATESKLKYFQTQNLHLHYAEMIRAELAEHFDVGEEMFKDLQVNFLDTNVLEERAKVGQSYDEWRLFLMSIGNQIQPYRRIVLDGLAEAEKERPRRVGGGEWAWRLMIDAVYTLENTGLPAELMEKRKALYPWTLEKARQVYLKNTTEVDDHTEAEI